MAQEQQMRSDKERGEITGNALNLLLNQNKGKRDKKKDKKKYDKGDCSSEDERPQ